jgi:D-beta-D-heptose 7-phosphate kinase/D-beta-D-heptose 1-phosphate adenosyltransferase
MDTYHNKIKTLEAAREECDRIKGSGKCVVFTNGCFDILHPGHTRYLHSAKELGDFLVVALNSDRSVRIIKGPKRPILGEEARAELLAALQCVDLILIFDEDNPLRVIRHLLPDILVKGGDWAEDDIIGADVVREKGGKVKRIPFVTGFSTTDIIKRIVRLHASETVK